MVPASSPASTAALPPGSSARDSRFPFPGRFIVLEGIDGAGTTTQRERLAAWLSGLGYAVCQTAEPSAGPVGRLIRSLLAAQAEPFDPEAMALLFAADRRDHIAREIRPQLAQGAVVISDRYVLSSLSYQTAAGVPRELVWQANHGGSGLHEPDLTLFVQVPVAVAAERRAKRKSPQEIYDDLRVQERVAAAYAHEAEALAARGRDCRFVDGAGSPEQVEALLRAAIEPILPPRPGR
jgi:dTMP kinase